MWRKCKFTDNGYKKYIPVSFEVRSDETIVELQRNSRNKVNVDTMEDKTAEK